MRKKEIRFYIDGMTCANCQNRIEQRLSRCEGVEQVRVSYRDGTARVVYDPERIAWDDIRRNITEMDYAVRTDDAPVPPAFARSLALLAVIIAAYVLLERLGVLTRLVPSRLADSGMGYGALFVTGLITSVHCVAMCGGISLSQSLPGGAKKSDAPMLPAVLYNAGRVLAYTATGFVLGLIGMLFSGAGGGISTVLQGILKIIAGLCMAVMGLNMLGIFPWLRRLHLQLPDGIRRRLGGAAAGTARPLLVGLANGLMPCGPLQSMQIIALASGSPFAGALSMLMFSLGTVPLMLGLGSLVSVLGKRFAKAVRTAGAVLVVVLGLAMLAQGGSLSGWLSPETLLYAVIVLSLIGLAACLPFFQERRALLAGVTAAAILAAFFVLQGVPRLRARTDGQPRVEDGVQYVQSTLEPGAYPDITLAAGVPVVWTIEAPPGTVNGCNYRMLLHEYGIAFDLEEGTNVLEFTPEDAGSYTYTCWMGMIRGTIHVTDESGPEEETAARRTELFLQ